MSYPGNDGYYNDLETEGRTGWRRYLPAGIKYVLALALLVVLDAIWMQLVAPLLGIKYVDIVESIQSAPLAWRWEGLMAYLILGYAAAFMTQAPTPEQSALQGAKIGFVIYGVFDFTSTFMYNGWTLKTAILDTCWGTVMYALIGWLLSYLSTTELWQRL